MTTETTKSARRFALQPKADAPSAADEQKDVTAKTTAAPRESKIALVTKLLTQPGGASLDEMVAATSWLPHTTRAALSGLRKKGHAVTSDKVDGVTRYAIATASQP